jgi:hypothetical protein
MDCARPGIQGTVEIPPGTTRVPCVGVYIFDPAGGRRVLSIGYLGGLDRGISLGHGPSNLNQGHVVGITGQAGTPVNPAGFGAVFPAMQPGFAGPEVQYVEFGASQPSFIAPAPGAPVFTADVTLSGAAAGDSFAIALMDLVTVWTGGTHGAFTTSAGTTLDTGGDVTPDQTPGLSGPRRSPWTLWTAARARRRSSCRAATPTATTAPPRPC